MSVSPDVFSAPAAAPAVRTAAPSAAPTAPTATGGRTSVHVTIPLDQGVLVLADSSCFDQAMWRPADGDNVGGGGWCIDLKGPDAEIVHKRVAGTWPRSVLVDGTYRIVVSDKLQAGNLHGKVLEQLKANDLLRCDVLVSPAAVSITKIRDAARGIGAAVATIGACQVVGAVASSVKGASAAAEIIYENGKATEIRIKLPA